MLDEALFEYYDIHLEGEIVSNAVQPNEPDEPDDTDEGYLPYVND